MTAAILWDLNGVIIDDMHFHLESFRIFLKDFNYVMTDEWFTENCTGTAPKEVFRKILPLINNPMSIEEAADKKRDIYFDIIKGKMQILPGVRSIVNTAQNHGIKQAIASGATKKEVVTVLDEFSIKNAFDAIVASEDVTYCKPNPEPFAKAACLIGMPTNNCVVIEDGEYGITAAHEAGCKVIAVTNTQTKEKLKKADLIVDSLEQISLNDIIKLIY